MMGRPRTIAPTENTMRMSTIVSERRYNDLKKLAKHHDITLGAAVRLCIDAAFLPPSTFRQKIFSKRSN